MNSQYIGALEVELEQIALSVMIHHGSVLCLLSLFAGSIANIKKTKMTISSEIAREVKKEGNSPYAVSKRVQKVIPCPANFVNAGHIRDEVVLEVNCHRMMRFTAGLV